MNLGSHRVNALELRLEDVVQVVAYGLECISHDGVGLGQDLLRNAPASLGTSLFRLDGRALISKDTVGLHADSDGDSADLRDLADRVGSLDGLPWLELLAEGVADLEDDLVTVATCGGLHSVAGTP